MTFTLVKPSPQSFVTGNETSFVTGNETAPKAGRPRKYATDADRLVAYRARNSVHQIRLESCDWTWVVKTAAAADISAAELINQMIKFAKSNRDWVAQPMFGRPLPSGSAKAKKP